MPMELLRELATQAMPIRIADPDKIDKLAVLYAAGLVEAQVSARDTPCPAQVFAITDKGRKALALDLGDVSDVF